uniref:ubiquitinyl hydrolase 1 n=1 Tax=Trichuris muris TaxID=70415 RepID=A0A5S6QY65_TRIMR
MTILPKKKSATSKEPRQSASLEGQTTTIAPTTGDFHGAHAVNTEGGMGGSTQSRNASPFVDGDGAVVAGAATGASWRLPSTSPFDPTADSESVFGGGIGRKRYAAVQGSRSERPALRCKQRSSGHVVPSTSSAPSIEGYNSEDESVGADEPVAAEDLETETAFENSLKSTKGFLIKKMRADGACMFRAVADQVYGDEDMHNMVRKLCINYMIKNSDYFSQFVTENFSDYVARKSQETAHGNHVELQAIAEMYNRPIEVYQYNTTPINTFFTNSSAGTAPIRLSYHRSSHYNSVIDPYNATIGVGLGLPQFFPGLADRNLMSEARLVSEQDAIEQAMLKDKLQATDWEATDAQLQQQIACESYFQWLADEKKRENQQSNDEANSSAAIAPAVSADPVVPVPDAVDLNPWVDDDDLLSHVLALSSQEYLDSLKKKKKENSEDEAGCSSRRTD